MVFRFMTELSFLAAFIVAAYCDNSEENNPFELILENIESLQHKVSRQGTKTIAHLDEKFNGLIELLQGNIEDRLRHISSVVETIDRRDRLAVYCRPGVCGENGTCDISDNSQGYKCTCDLTHFGDHCEFELGPCEEFLRLETTPTMPAIPLCDNNGYYKGIQYRESMTSAFVCPPNYCASMKCPSLTADSCTNGLIKPNAGFCGCCDACIVQIAEDDRCLPINPSGVPVTSECAEGLYCDPKTSTCIVKDLGPCATELASVEARLQQNPPLLGLERPRCEADGTYSGMQYRGSQAFCVTSSGTRIDDYMVNRWETGEDMNCQCARDEYDYMQTGLIGKMFFCDKNGNYAPVGCTGSVCYCQDTYGKQVGTSTVGIWQKDSLNC